MRVLWISVFIFLVVVLFSLVLHEPAENQHVQQSSLGPSQPSDPFVSEKVEDKQVELAALPAGAGESLNAEEPQLAPLISSDASQSNLSQPSVPQPDEAQFSSAGVSPNDVEQTLKVSEAQQIREEAVVQPGDNVTASESESTVSVATDAIEPELSPQSRPLGLLARSIQKKKNQNKLAVIVNLDNSQELTIDEIRAMYMDQITHWQDGSKIMLYNLPLGDSHREKFSQNILNMSALEADEAETERRDNHLAINSVRVKAKNIVVSYVEREPNAIAYVPLSFVREKSHVKIIATFP